MHLNTPWNHSPWSKTSNSAQWCPTAADMEKELNYINELHRKDTSFEEVVFSTM
jgi:hypothetical protein